VKLVLNVGPPRKQANRGNSVNDSIAEGAFSARYYVGNAAAIPTKSETICRQRITMAPRSTPAALGSVLGGTLSSGMGVPANNRRQGLDSQRAQRPDHETRALSVAIPVSAYI